MYLTITDTLTTHSRTEWEFVVQMKHDEIVVVLNRMVELIRNPRARNWTIVGKYSQRVHEQRSLSAEVHRERPDIPAHIRDKVLAQLNMLIRIAL